MQYRLIAFDLDGTLLDGEKHIPPENLAALYAAAERGMHIVLATGRIYPGLPEELRKLPFLRWCITINGAYVYDAEEDSAVHALSNKLLDTEGANVHQMKQFL